MLVLVLQLLVICQKNKILFFYMAYEPSINLTLLLLLYGSPSCFLLHDLKGLPPCFVTQGISCVSSVFIADCSVMSKWITCSFLIVWYSWFDFVSPHQFSSRNALFLVSLLDKVVMTSHLIFSWDLFIIAIFPVNAITQLLMNTGTSVRSTRFHEEIGFSALSVINCFCTPCCI